MAPDHEERGRRSFAVCGVRRRIAFSNPLLNFDRIAFLTHGRTCRGYNHMCDQYFGFNAMPGGSLFVLEKPFSDAPAVRNLLAGAVVENGRLQGRRLCDLEGSFISLELAYDASVFYFAWTEALPEAGTWRPETCYHIFRVGADGSGLRQLTGPGTISILLSPRRAPGLHLRTPRRVRLPQRRMPIHPAQHGADGSAIAPLSVHETNE